MSNSNTDSNKNNNVYISRSLPIEIDDNQMSKVYIFKNKTTITTTKNPMTSIGNYRKSTGNKTIDLTTGECIEHRPPRSRRDNIASIKRSCGYLMKLVDNNFEGLPNEKHLTLTYSNHETDYQKVVHDFKCFMNRLRYTYGQLEYIRIVEVQQNKRLHLHVLVKSTTDTLFLDYSKVRAIWGHGRIRIENVPSNPNFSSYFCMQFLNIDESEES